MAGAIFAWLGWTAHFHLSTFPITIVYTNDFHGNILPHKGKGGSATITAYLKKIKKPYLLLDAGDFFQGTPESDLSSGRNTVLLMNRMKYDAATLGNHEFDFGIKNLRALVKAAEFPMLSSNIYYTATNERIDFALPNIIRNINGAKIGIFGLTSDRTPQMSIPENVKGLDFRNPIEESKKIISELKNKNADLIIALTHLGIEKNIGNFTGDKTLATETEGIDIIVGGHSHMKIERLKIKKTYIVQTPGLGKTLGRISLRLDNKTKKIRSFKNRIVPMEVKKIGEDNETKKIVSEMTKEISERLSEKIGFCETDLIRKRNGESNIGNFLADAMRNFAKTDVAFHNSGGIRTDIKKGDITLRDIYTLNPFNNTVITMKLTGVQLKEIMGRSFEGTYGILQVSGIKTTYDKALKKVEAKINGKPLKDSKTYTAATNSFLASGGDDFKIFTEGKNIKDTNTKFRDVIIAHIKKTKNISAKTDGRILIIETNNKVTK